MHQYTHLLQNEIVCALGCTEPSAVAMAVAKAAETLGKKTDRIELSVSGNVLKNAMHVGIPKTNLKGIEIAAALGCIAGRSDYRLEVLKDIGETDIQNALRMVQEKKIRISVADTSERLYIKAVCFHGEEQASAVIQKYHTNITSVCFNDETLYFKEEKQMEEKASDMNRLTVKKIFNYVCSVTVDELKFLDEVIDRNMKIAQEGLKKEYGLGVGKHLYEKKLQSGQMDFQTYLVSLVSAAIDARMAGCTLPVMSTNGSGNQGLTASIPVIAAAELMGSKEEQKYRALALSELITIHVKGHIGKLSALCGCAIASSVGVSCALTYLMGGSLHNIEYAIMNMVADISGLICDGAKSGCALKIATSVNGAIQCANLAVDQVKAPQNDGIVCKDVEQTIKNLGKLGNHGMSMTDHVILDMMLAQKDLTLESKI